MDMADVAGRASVDPEVRKFVDGLAEGYRRYASEHDAPPARRREIAELVREPWRTGGPVMAETRDFEHDGVRLRLHRPTLQADLPMLIYIHGGGWMLFSIDTHDRLMREYAHRAGIAVLGVDYSLAPEVRYPVALNEIDGVVRWAEDMGARELGIEGQRIVIGGDSAGANLAVATCLKRRDEGRTSLAGMLLSYGAFDPRHRPSYDLYTGPEFTLEAGEMDAFWENYVGDAALLDDPLVAPIKADLRGLPSAHLTVAECDVLADSNVEFAQALKASAVPLECNLVRGATHSFLEAMSVAVLADRALDQQARWLANVVTA